MWFEDLKVGEEYAILFTQVKETRVVRAVMEEVSGPGNVKVRTQNGARWGTMPDRILHTWKRELETRDRATQTVNKLVEELTCS